MASIHHAAHARRRRIGGLLTVERLETRLALAAIPLTAHEQFLLELVNRARSEPAAEAARLGIDLNAGLAAGTISTAAKQPLAPHAILLEAAGRHAQDMLDRDYFDHDNPEGQGPTQRAAALGYVGGVGENIAWGGEWGSGGIDQTAHVQERHEGLFRSSGHRRNLMRTDYREMGPGVRFGEFTEDGSTFDASMVSQSFGFGTRAALTGVAFTDTVSPDRFYTVGEGLADIDVTATNGAGTSFTTTTGPSGGYTLPLAAGMYRVVFSRGAETTAGVSVVIGASNVKLDFDGAFDAAVDPGDPTDPVDPEAPADPGVDAPFAVESLATPVAGVYGRGTALALRLTLSRPAAVTGRPALPVVVGGRTLNASLTAGSGSVELTFTLVVPRAVSIAEVRLGDALRLRGPAAIRAADGTALPTALPAGIANAVLDGVAIDTLSPRTVGAVGLPEAGTYRAGDVLRFTVTFSEAVAVGGTPSLTLFVKPGLSGLRRAALVSTDGAGRVHTFEYTLVAADVSGTGRVLRLGRSIGGGTIVDVAGNAATRTLSAASTSRIRIAGTPLPAAG